MPYKNPRRFYTRLAFSYSIGPSSVVRRELGPAPPFPPTRALEMRWSRALSLMCELALRVLFEGLTMGIRCGRLACSASTEDCQFCNARGDDSVCLGAMFQYLYRLCHKLILGHLWNESSNFKCMWALCDCLQYFYLEDVLEWHMARLLVGNGHWEYTRHNESG